MVYSLGNKKGITKDLILLWWSLKFVFILHLATVYFMSKNRKQGQLGFNYGALGKT